MHSNTMLVTIDFSNPNFDSWPPSPWESVSPLECPFDVVILSESPFVSGSTVYCLLKMDILIASVHLRCCPRMTPTFPGSQKVSSPNSRDTVGGHGGRLGMGLASTLLRNFPQC